MYEYMGFLHIWSQIVLYYSFIDACLLLIYPQVGVTLPVVTEYSFVYFCEELALIRSCFCLDLVAMALIHF